MRFLLCFVLLETLAAGAAGAADHTVTMAGLQYRPSALTARVGDVIHFVNDDGTDHHVFVPTGGFAIDFGPQKPGTTVEMPSGKAGTFEVECVFHPHMLLKVRVTR
jgi:plastocyanin